MRFIIMIVLLLLEVSPSLAGNQQQEEQEQIGDSSAAIRKIDRALRGVSEQPVQGIAEPGRVILPEGVSLAELDESTKEKYFESLQEYFQYRISGYQHRKKVFEWQLRSSIIIFIVVVFLVSAGIYFSWLQFRQSLESRRTKALRQERQNETAAKGTNDVVTKDMEATKLEVSSKGIKVSSPILGVIILIISLLFFYLYLVYVYPIEEIF